jgi:hypothetical protein
MLIKVTVMTILAVEVEQGVEELTHGSKFKGLHPAAACTGENS